MIEPICDRRVNVLRRTADLLPATSAAQTMSASIARQPGRAARMGVTVASGTAGSGQVTVGGTLDSGAAGSETLAFSANGTLRTARLFTGLSTVTTSGLADESTVPTVRVQALDEQGSPQPVSYAVASGMPAHLAYMGAGDWAADRQGTHESDGATVLLPYHDAWQPQVGDLIEEEDTGDRWLVRRVNRHPTPLQPMWFDLKATRYTT